MDNSKSGKKFYSVKAIAIASFLATPIVSGYMLWHNYKVVGLKEIGKKYFACCVLFTVVLICILGSLPEQIQEKIPRQLVPVLYTGAIYGFVREKQNDLFYEHQTELDGYYGAGVCFLTMLPVLVLLIVLGICIVGML